MFYFSLHFTTESSSDVFIFSSTVHTPLSTAHSALLYSAPGALLSSAPQHHTSPAVVQVEAAVAFTTVTAALPDILPVKMTN